MKILCLQNKVVYTIDAKKDGENAMQCPVCTETRRHKNKKSFSWNNQKSTGYCHNCDSRFVEYKPMPERKVFTRPKITNRTELTGKALEWFLGRGISQGALNKLGVYSSTEFMPQTGCDRTVVCFPYYLDEQLVNIKFRDAAKNFKLVKDAELIFYNINALKDSKEIIIVEGEIDCLSYIEAGIDNCISVPNGASAKNLAYLDNYVDLFDGLEKIYLATDNDLHGFELREELIRRLGAEKCFVVNFGEFKDANEYLVNKGKIALAQTITNATEVPVEGVIKLQSHYDDIYSMFISGAETGFGIGIEEIDKAVTWETGRLAVFTGIPSHGKSEFVDYICTRLNLIHGWKVGYFSPENYPVKYHYSKLASKISGKKFEKGYISREEYDRTFDYISNNFYFIYPEEDMSVDNVLAKAKHLVRRYGIRVMVFDPYNKIEHMRDRGETETEYISRFLDRMIMFGKRHNVLVFLVAHPRKMEKAANGAYIKPTLYDINGSANFYNKADYGISIYRDFNTNKTTASFLKVKFKHLGDGGDVELKYNYINGRYENIDSEFREWSDKSYLDKEEEVLPPRLEPTDYCPF